MQVNSRVMVTRLEGSWLREATWWPVSDITGTVTKICKNGSVYIAQDQFKNNSQDGKRTRIFSIEDKVLITEL